MTPPTYAKAIAEVLERAGAQQDPALSAASRATGIEAVRRAIELRQRKRNGLRLLASVALAAGFLASAWPRTQPRDVEVRVAELRGAATVIAPDGTHAAQLGNTLSQGARLITAAQSGATLKLSSGTELALGRATDLEVRSGPSLQRFQLQSGALRADVAHLPEGQRFLIGTPDAEVEVHGTAFRVEISDPGQLCAGSRTRVVVERGVVSVRHGATVERLTAGGRWPAQCTPALIAPTPTPAPALAPAVLGSAPVATPPLEHRRRATAHRRPAPVSASETLSQLAEQNDAFAAALQVARSGDPEAAVAQLTAFLARYPQGVLAESAAAQRLRLLAALDPPRARAAAERYLARFPSGSAVQEAQQLLGASSR